MVLKAFFLQLLSQVHNLHPIATQWVPLGSQPDTSHLNASSLLAAKQEVSSAVQEVCPTKRGPPKWPARYGSLLRRDVGFDMRGAVCLDSVGVSGTAVQSPGAVFCSGGHVSGPYVGPELAVSSSSHSFSRAQCPAAILPLAAGRANALWMSHPAAAASVTTKGHGVMQEEWPPALQSSHPGEGWGQGERPQGRVE